MPRNSISSHRLLRPWRQYPQAPHASWKGTATRSPTVIALTWAPTSTTSPANSWPIVIGSGGARPTQDQSPCHVCQSVRQMPSTTTLTIASRGPGGGSGTSSITRGWAISTSRAALNSSSSRSRTHSLTAVGQPGPGHADLCSVYVEWAERWWGRGRSGLCDDGGLIRSTQHDRVLRRGWEGWMAKKRGG